MRHSELVPSRDNTRVRSFCTSICPDARPIYIPVEPQDGCSLARCFPNVEEIVRIRGGKLVQGWDISQIPKIQLEATWHAVWQPSRRMFVDVTPQESGQSHILFLPDVHRSYNGTLVPSHRFSLGDTALVARYQELSDEINRIRLELWSAGMGQMHPAWRQRLGGLFAEIHALKERLQDDT